MELQAAPLTAPDFAPYGFVLEAGGKPVGANNGTASRSNGLASLENLRAHAGANLCVFRCKPIANEAFRPKLLERHPFSTQVFVPMAAKKGFLVLVAQGGDQPDLKTLKAFLVSPQQGIAYRPGIWHHPLAVLEAETDMACLVYEDGTKGDCETRPLPDGVVVNWR